MPPVDFGLLCFQRAPFPVPAVPGMLPKQRGPGAAPSGLALGGSCWMWRLLPAPGTAAGSPSPALNCSWGFFGFAFPPRGRSSSKPHGWEPMGRAGASLALLHCSSTRAGARAAAALAGLETALDLSLSPPQSIPKSSALPVNTQLRAGNAVQEHESQFGNGESALRARKELPSVSSFSLCGLKFRGIRGLKETLGHRMEGP